MPARAGRSELYEASLPLFVLNRDSAKECMPATDLALCVCENVSVFDLPEIGFEIEVALGRVRLDDADEPGRSR